MNENLIGLLKGFGMFFMMIGFLVFIGRPVNKMAFKEELEQEKAMNLKGKGWSLERWFFCDILAFPKKDFMN